LTIKFFEMAHGGKRTGAGRKVGSTILPRLSQYVTEAERKAFVKHVMFAYKSNPRLAVWVGDQLFGKAFQALDITSGGQSLVDEALKTKADAAIAAYLHGGKK